MLRLGWTNLEDIMQSETSQTQKDNAVWFHLYERPRVVKFIETESRLVFAKGWGWGRRVDWEISV